MKKTKIKETEKEKKPLEKIKKLEKYLPLFWNSYQHMYDVRERNIQSNINFLLVVTTFLPAFCIALFNTKQFSSTLILFPIIFQFIALIILLRSFFMKGSSVHWFKLGDMLKEFDENKFEINLISDLKSLEAMTHVSMRAKAELIKVSVYFILISLLLGLLSIIFILLDGNMNIFLLFVIIIFVLSFLIFKFYKKQPEYKFKEDYKSYNYSLNKWLNMK